MRIMLLKAGRGDSLLLSWKDHNMLIDSGTPATLRINRNPKLPPLKDIDFFVLTHIDFDHIGGFIDILKKSDITNFHENLVFYANQLELITCKENENVGYHHGSFLSDHIRRLGINNQGLKSGDSFNIDDAIFTVLSPEEKHLQILAKQWGDLEYDDIPEINTFVSMENKEFEVCLNNLNKEIKHEPESDIINFSSIALLISYSDKTILLLGDSHSSVVSKGIRNILRVRKENKLKIDILKVSHHGSKNNTTMEFLDLIICNRFIISTDGSRPYNHPHPETIAKIIISTKKNGFENIYFYFNYELAASFHITNESDLGINVYKEVLTEVDL